MQFEHTIDISKGVMAWRAASSPRALDDGACALRAGVAAKANDERQEEGELHMLGEQLVKVLMVVRGTQKERSTR